MFFRSFITSLLPRVTRPLLFLSCALEDCAWRRSPGNLAFEDFNGLSSNCFGLLDGWDSIRCLERSS